MPSRALTRFCSRRDTKLLGATPVTHMLPCPTPRSTTIDLMSGPADFGLEIESSGLILANSATATADLRGGSPSCVCTLSGAQMARRRRTSAQVILDPTPYRVQPFGSSHGEMNPVVTGNCCPSGIECIPPSISESHGSVRPTEVMK